MGNNIKLKYSDISSIMSGFKTANESLSNAYRILGESTDLGSSIMQSFWQFGNKEAIFGAIKSARKNIHYQMEENTKLANLLNSIDDMYESAARIVSKHSSYQKLLSSLGVVSPIILSLVYPSVFAGLSTIWAGGKIVSTFRKNSTPKTTVPSVNTTPGVTQLIHGVEQTANQTAREISKKMEVKEGQCLNDIWQNWGPESPNGFTNYNGKGNCTWYADHRWAQMNPENPLVFSRTTDRNAKKWADAIDRTNFNVNSTADSVNIKGNAIAVSQSGTYGHVAYIEKVQDGKVYFTEDGESYTRPHTWQKNGNGNWVGPTVQTCFLEEFKKKFGYIITSK